jgi:hypothetical protein
MEHILRATPQYKTDPEFITMVKGLVQHEYFSLCRKHSWAGLRRMTTIDFDGATSTGMWLPANMFGIDAVRDEDNGFIFWHRNRDELEPDETGYRYMTYRSSQTAAFDEEDLILRQEGTTFQSALLTADGTDYTGDYVKFGTEPGFYLLSGALAFGPAYWGPNMTQKRFIIRPKETERMVIYDPDETVLLDRTVEVYYWEAPEPLYRDEDVPTLPSADLLELKVLRRLPEARERRPVSQSEIREVEADTLALNPDFSIDNPQRDRQKALFRFRGSDSYQER